MIPNKRSEKVQEQLSQITAVSQESFSGIRIIKSFGHELNTWKIFLKSCKDYTSRQIQLVKIEAMFFPLIVTMIGMSTIFTIYIGGIESFKGNITTGNIAEFIIYINMLTWPVAVVGWVTSIVQQAEASQKRINDFLKERPDIKDGQCVKSYIKGSIEFDDVSLFYPETKIKALKSVKLKISAGSTVGIIGNLSLINI